MAKTNPWKKAYLHELEQAENARSGGNEGMARVCARRAAGIAIGEYFAREGLPDIDPSAHERIKQLRYSPGTSDEVRCIADHLLQRVDVHHNLPPEVDLIAETHQLVEALL